VVFCQFLGVLVTARRVQVSVCVYIIYRRALVVDRERHPDRGEHTVRTKVRIHDTDAPQTTPYQRLKL